MRLFVCVKPAISSLQNVLHRPRAAIQIGCGGEGGRAGGSRRSCKAPSQLDQVGARMIHTGAQPPRRAGYVRKEFRVSPARIELVGGGALGACAEIPCAVRDGGVFGGAKGRGGWSVGARRARGPGESSVLTLLTADRGGRWTSLEAWRRRTLRKSMASPERSRYVRRRPPGRHSLGVRECLIVGAVAALPSVLGLWCILTL